MLHGEGDGALELLLHPLAVPTGVGRIHGRHLRPAGLVLLAGLLQILVA